MGEEEQNEFIFTQAYDEEGRGYLKKIPKPKDEDDESIKVKKKKKSIKK